MGVSTSCAGCVRDVPNAIGAHEPVECRQCWDPVAGVRKNWEPIKMPKQSLFVDTPLPQLEWERTGGTEDRPIFTGTPTVAGRKDDSGKLDVTLFFDDLPHAIEAVTEVLQWAVTKKQPKPYERGSWQGVEDFSRRYRGAQFRHQLNRAKGRISGAADGIDGEPLDAETGLMELAHIATDAMFLLEMAVRKVKGLPTPSGA